MRFSQIAGVIATGSVGANAFLLPPTVSKADADRLAGAVSLGYTPAGDHTRIAVSCPGCDVAFRDAITGEVDESKLTNTIDSDLAFLLSVAPKSAQDEADRLMINGVQVYPVEPQAEGFGSVLKADQFVKQAGSDFIYIESPVVGYMLSTESLQTGQDVNLVKVHFEVVQLRDKDVRIPALDIQLIETPSGKLTLAQVDVSNVAEAKEGQCNSALCRFKAMIASKFSKLKGCMRKPKHSDPRPNVQVGPAHGSHGGHARPSSAMIHGRPRPHHKGPHHGHGHRRHGGVARFMSSLVFHVLIPILLGVAMGIAASLVGMIVGHLAIFLWQTVFRRNQRSEYQKVDQAEAAEGKEDSEALLAPPVYEEAPAYEEAVDEKQ